MKVVYNSYGGRYSDNPRAIYELLVGRDEGHNHVWLADPLHLHGFPAGAELRRALALVKTRSELDELLDALDPDVPFPPAANGPRGRQGSAASVALPEGWLTDPDDCTVPTGADVMHSGG